VSASLADRVYPRLPVWAQNAACGVYGLREARVRFGRDFRERLDRLTEMDGWSAADIAAYQDEQVRALVKHAYDSVPFYRERMRSAGLTPDDVRGRADLPKLPILTKEDVRANLPRLVSERVDRKRLIHRHTSGTTGKALDFYSSRASIAFQWAVWWRHRRRFGVEPGALSANFTGKLVVPMEQRRPPYWRWNRPMNQALLNMQHVTPDKAPAIAAFLDRHPFVLYTGYPSIVHALAATALELGIELHSRPKLVITGAENVLDFQRRDIAAWTGALLTDQYGFSEGCGNASHCTELRYHEDWEFGVLECVDPQTLPDGRVRGRLVCTGFACPEFPFLRYEVGDTAVWAPPGERCACGRHSAVIDRIEGRMDDYVVTPEGGRIMRFDYLFKDTPMVRESQVVQDRPGAITLRLVRRPGYGTGEEAYLRGEVARWISPLLDVEFEYVDEIPREASGKFRAVLSRLGPGGRA
jgi:phenylacetate-CoA ligase